MRFSGFVRLGLLAIAAALSSWAQTSTSTACTIPSSAVFGQPVKINAMVATSDTVPTGSITFFDGSNVIGTASLDGFGNAQISTSFVPGVHGITCTYSGDASHTASVSAVGLLTVTPATPNITLTPSMNPVPVGQLLEIDIVVSAFSGAPQGSVTLLDGNKVLGVFFLLLDQDSSFAQFKSNTLAGGTHFITATYDGDGSFFAPSTTKQPLVLVIGRRTTTTAIRSVSPSPANFGQPVIVQVAVTSDIGTPTGSISLTENANALASAALTAGAASITLNNLASGTHAIVANYSGDTTFDISASPPFNLLVNGAVTSTQLTVSPNPVQVGHTVTLTATVTSSAGTPTGTVTFYNASPQGPLGSATLDSSGQATLATSFATLGDQNITAFYPATVQFAASNSPSVALTVIPRQLTITSASSFKMVVSPDSLASIFGDNLVSIPATAGLPPWPMMLGDVSLVFRDNTGTERMAALKFVSAGQINAVVPPDMPLGPATAIVRSSSGVDIETGPAIIADVAPGLFSGDGTGTGAAAAAVEIVHPDGTTSLQQAFRCDGNGKCTTMSIDLGSDGDRAFLILFGTGMRRGGQATRVRISGQDLTPDYAGPQPQIPGVDQVNVLLPVSLRGAGDVTAQIVIGSQLSNVVALHFQ